MSSNKIFQKLIAMFEGAPIKKTMGMTLEFTDMGEVQIRMPADKNFYHGMKGGDLHGGIIATLLDTSGWFTVAAHYNRFVLTADLNIRLLEAAKRQALLATGNLIRPGKHLAVAEMRLTSEDSRLIAYGSGSFTVTSKEIVKTG